MRFLWIHLCTAVVRFHFSMSTLRSGILTRSFQNLFFSHSDVDLLVCFGHCPVAWSWPKLTQNVAVRQVAQGESNSCFSKSIDYVFPSWICVNTHQNVPDQQNEVCTPLYKMRCANYPHQPLMINTSRADDKQLAFLNPMEAVTGYLIVPRWVIFFSLIFVK